METKRKKELLLEYKNRKPEMGVISYCCNETGAAFLGISSDIKADFNSNTFRLNMGGHPNKALQKLWKQYGVAGFTLSVVKKLKYKDPAEDYTDKLEALRQICFQENQNAEKLK